MRLRHCSCRLSDGVYLCLFFVFLHRTTLLVNNVKLMSKEIVPTFSADDVHKIKKFCKAHPKVGLRDASVPCPCGRCVSWGGYCLGKPIKIVATEVGGISLDEDIIRDTRLHLRS